MQKRNFGQAKKQREQARKVRQQQKLERKHARSQPPATDAVAAGDAAAPADADTVPKDPT
jgi:hypothetical protein